ncbi:MAG: hypothetical protein AAF215_10245 [Cyanobacteria bacterium P01_A01_bin.123]
MILPRHRCWWPAILATALASLFIIFPPSAKADSERVEFTFDVYGEVTYESIWQEAEGLARQAIDATFAQDANVSEVVLVIMADRNGRIVPLVSLNVPRSEWQVQSNLARWIAWAAPSFSSETLLAIGVSIPDRPPAANPRPQRTAPVDSIDPIENDPAFRDD